MVILRFLGWILFLLALMAAGAESFLALEQAAWSPIAFGELWYGLDAGSLNLLQALVQRYLHPEIWDPWIVAVLTAPAWLVLLVPALALIVLARPRRARRWFAK